MRNNTMLKRKIEKPKPLAAPLSEEEVREKELQKFTADLRKIKMRSQNDEDNENKPFYFDIANGKKKKGK